MDGDDDKHRLLSVHCALNVHKITIRVPICVWLCGALSTNNDNRFAKQWMISQTWSRDWAASKVESVESDITVMLTKRQQDGPGLRCYHTFTHIRSERFRLRFWANGLEFGMPPMPTVASSECRRIFSILSIVWRLGSRPWHMRQICLSSISMNLDRRQYFVRRVFCLARTKSNGIKREIVVFNWAHITNTVIIATMIVNFKDVLRINALRNRSARRCKWRR